jgi:NurA-like 5'-3' nuclease
LEFKTHQRNARAETVGFVGFLYIWKGICSLRIKNTIMTTIAEREELKKVILELIKEDNSEIKNVIRDIVAESIQDSDKEFSYLLEKNFTRFEKTFNALA